MSSSPSSSLGRRLGRVPPLATCALVGGHLGLLLTFDLTAHPAATLACLGAGLAGLGLAARPRASTGLRPGGILLLAAVLRVVLLPLPPTLSDDLLRYLWDGRVVAAGFNPYRLAPEAPELAALRDGSWHDLPHRDLATVYPPLAMAAFSISARLPAPLLAWKMLLSVADLATCALLLALSRRRGHAPSRVIWYAWNPLATLEVAGMGHVDALGVLAVVATVLLLSGHRPRRAAVAAAAGVLAKLVPVVALPMWARQSARPGRFLLIAGGLSAAALVPVVVATGGVPPGLVAYSVSWEFNGPLFEPLWRLLDAADVAPTIKAGLDGAKRWSGRHELWNPIYPWVYPQLLAKLVLAAALAAAVVASWRKTRPEAGAGFVFGAVILCSATVYPWYLLWVLPWAALCRQPAWLLLCATVLLAYLPRLTGVAAFPSAYLAVWLPFFILLAWRRRWSTA